VSAAKVQAELHRLRRFRPESVDLDATVLGAAAALELALDDLRARSGDLPTPGSDIVEDVRAHVRNCRVLAELFELVATRFERSQLGDHLPSVFARPSPRWIGPYVDGNRPDDRTWLDAQLAKLRGWSSERSRSEATALRKRIGLVEARPFVVHTRTITVTGGLSLGASVKGESVWEIEERSDGTTMVTLRAVQSGGVGTGLGGTVAVACGDVELGGDIGVGLGLDAATTTGWRKAFPSRAEADEFVERHRARAVGEAAGSMVPLAGGWLAGQFNLSGMQDATVTERSEKLSASASVDATVALGVPAGVALDAGAGGRVLERRDRDARTITDSVTTTLTGGVTAAFGAILPLNAAHEAEVSVTRDEKGEARSLTVRVAAEAVAGLRPSLPTAGPLAAQPWTDPSIAPPATPADPGRRYEVEVVVDLTDPRNAELAEGLATKQSRQGRLDEDLAAFDRGIGLDGDVLGRSHVTVLEQVPEAGSDCSIDVSAGLLVEAGGEARVATSSFRTIAAWQNQDGTLVPVSVGGS
jgi:hypothetical protein